MYRLAPRDIYLDLSYNTGQIFDQNDLQRNTNWIQDLDRS